MATPPVNPVLQPVQALCRREGYSTDIAYDLLARGEFRSLLVGRLRMIVVASYRAYVDRRLCGIEIDPAERAANIAAYRASIDHERLEKLAAGRRAAAAGRRKAAASVPSAGGGRAAVTPNRAGSDTAPRTKSGTKQTPAKIKGLRPSTRSVSPPAAKASNEMTISAASATEADTTK